MTTPGPSSKSNKATTASSCASPSLTPTTTVSQKPKRPFPVLSLWEAITLPLLRSIDKAYGPIMVIHFDSHLYVATTPQSVMVTK